MHWAPTLTLLLSLSLLWTAQAGSELVLGDIRVQALSPTLIRVEPKGPMGFENRTTFMVTNRTASQSPELELLNTSAAGTYLGTKHYIILINSSPSATGSCTRTQPGDVSNARRSHKFPLGFRASDREACCAACASDPTCTAWVRVTDSAETAGGINCWPLSSFGASVSSPHREVGCVSAECGLVAPPAFSVFSLDGEELYNSSTQTEAAPNLLHWPSPLSTSAYAQVDYPRFYVPSWGTAPIPSDAKVEPRLVPTNGYDFENNVVGDTYVFLLGANLDDWNSARAEFIQWVGGSPVLPDFAYGTWFTWWHSYTESEAKSDVERWISDKLPIDVWALDMNWRNTTNHQDWYYDHPAVPNLFDNFTDWFGWLKDRKLRTYFNDHPYPVAMRGAGGLQTSAEEVSFRWSGLTKWMAKGLTYWWFDHNWGFSIPPPFVNTSVTSGSWHGLDNAAWGSHVYFNAVEQFDRTVRDKEQDTFYGGRPMTLTKFGLPDWRPGMDPKGAAESPAQHRYPVWWTGDGVNLQASVQSMVDSGVHGFKPFVHSDCGGDYRPKQGGDLLRWTAHCTFGTILRFHGNDHRPWTYTPEVEDTIRSYLNVRYSLIPSLIAAGHETSSTGAPLAARGDLFWPEYAPESASNDQYIHLTDTLVAPIFDSAKNQTSRSVWIPPGEWQDAWSGQTVTGPKTITTTQPYEKQPMWHRRGGLLVTCAPAMRVDDLDFTTLTLLAFPSSTMATTVRTVYDRGTSSDVSRQRVEMNTNQTHIRFSFDAAPAVRSWTLRLNLEPLQRVSSAQLSCNNKVRDLQIKHIEPVAESLDFFPFGGVGTAPAPLAGTIAEVTLSAESLAQTVVLSLA